MRNPLARFIHRDYTKPTLRERLKATKEKYTRTCRRQPIRTFSPALTQCWR